MKHNAVWPGWRWAGVLRFAVAALVLGIFVLASRAQTVSPFNLPLYFEASPDRTEFLSRGSGYQILITSGGAQIALRNGAGQTATARMSFEGAHSTAAIRGDGELPGKINYLIGSDPSKWQTGLPTFSKVQIAEIYPGVDLVFHGNQQQLEYDFAIAPGANPGAIKMRFDGTNKISISPDGELVLKIGQGEIRQPKPEIYQTVNGFRKIIGGGYKILDARTVAFNIGDYDHSLSLVIDPLLGFSSYFGANSGTIGWAIARDANDFTYIAGQTFSKQFFTKGAFQTNFAGGTLVGDAFVAKFGDPATNLIYLTYLGGNSEDAAYAIAADSSSHAFVTGLTQSTNFPVTNAIPGFNKITGKIDPNVNRFSADIFVTELSADGSSLVYSTYFGGNAADGAYGIALDSADNAYITGFTYSTNFPVFPDSSSVFQNHLACSNNVYLNANAFVAEIPSGGGAVPVYSSYLGGTNFDVGRGIAVDANNYVYIAGYTASTNFPVINEPTNQFPNFPAITHLNGATNSQNRVPFDAFVTKFPPLVTHPSSLSSLVYSTFLGGTNADQANGIAADSEGNAYVTGWTTSTNFPVVFSSLINTNPAGLYSFLTTNGNAFSGVTNVFLTKIAPQGSNILNSIVFGGNRMDIGYGVAVDSAGDTFVVGTAMSTNFPTFNAFTSLSHTNSGGLDVFVTGINANWTNTYYSVMLGGKKDEQGYGIVLDSATNVFITGGTGSTNYPTANTGRFSFTFTNNINITNFTFITNDVSGTNVITTNTTVIPTNVVVVTNVINGTNYINGNNFTGTNDAFLSEILFTTPSPTNITLVPTSQIVGVGETARFALTVTGISTPVLYQWQREIFTNQIITNIIVGVSTNKVTNSVPSGVFTNLPNSGRFSGATSNILTITNCAATDSSSNYQAVVTWGEAPYITNAVLDVEQGPVIAVPPADQTNFFGGTATFTVTAFGQSPLHYQWLFDGTNLVNSTGHVSGATNNTLTITGLTTNNMGTFDVVITNAFGSTNASATLTMLATSPTNITLVPTNDIVGIGGTARFTLTVAGTSTPVFYQWQREIYTNQIITNTLVNPPTKTTNSVPSGVFTNIQNSGRFRGATSNILTITNVITTDSSSNYQAVITWGEAPYITNATLQVEQGPVIAIPPVDQTNFFGGTATFSVTAFGQSPLHYQWLFDGTNLANSAGHVSGATTNVLIITGLNTNNEGTFEVVVTNAFGSTNASATLTMLTTSPTNITLVPTNDIVGVGGTARFTLTVAGTSTPVFFQWQREIYTNQIITNIMVGVSTNKVTNSLPSGVFTNIQNAGRFRGATSNVLTITNVITTDSSSNYQAVIAWGEAPYITNATLDVEQGPVIVVPPVDQTNAVGSPVTFTVTAFGQPPLHYQWLFDGTNLANSTGHVSGATTNVLTITGLTTNNEGTFEVVVTNLFGATNASATLTLITAPVLTTTPNTQTVGLGAPVDFVVTAIGAPPLNYSWTFNGTTVTNGGIISGATNSVLFLNGVTTNNSGTYVVTVTNTFGMTNASAALTVLTAPRLSVSQASGFATNGVLSFDVVGGTNNGFYNLLFTNNLLAPASTWPRIGPAQFGVQGELSFTLQIDTNVPQQFYMLQFTNPF